MSTHLQTVKASLAQAVAQQQQIPTKDPIAPTGVNMQQLKNKLAPIFAGNKPQPVVKTTPAVKPAPSTNGEVHISLNNKKVVEISYRTASTGQTVQVKTTNAFLAAIMNLFAMIFPCVKGAAKFNIDNETVYVRRSLLQAKLPEAQIRKADFREKDAAANTISLEAKARTHFTS